MSVSEIWNEVNKRNNIYIETLAKKYNIGYNRGTHQLVIDEDEQSINVEERRDV